MGGELARNHVSVKFGFSQAAGELRSRYLVLSTTGFVWFRVRDNTERDWKSQ